MIEGVGRAGGEGAVAWPDRRRFLRLAGAVATAASAAACGFVPGEQAADEPDVLTVALWGTEAELAAFRALADLFARRHPGARVALDIAPYENFFTNIDARLQAGRPPDLFRVDYDTFGVYAGAKQLLDLSKLLPPGFGERFTPAMWQAVCVGRTPFGVPHHTDTSVILYNVEALRAAGVTEVPRTPEEAWTWEQFDQVAVKLRRSAPAGRYPFVVNWQSTGVTRWLTWLFAAGGRFLGPDLRTPAIDAAAGRAALDFTRGFFQRGLVPPNSSVKATTYASDTWYAQTTAMTFGGAFLLPDANSTLDFAWGATYAPRHVRAGSDLGGNALVATAATTKPALAAAFLDLVTQQEPMRQFCTASSALPTRRDLTAANLRFTARPELTPVFLGQAATVQPQDAAQVASPAMDAINLVLSDQLEEAFVGGQDTGKTLAAMAEGIAAATARRP
ncbi:extracellular solute-binding protein [Amycolatopsis sp. PS_44_ISF1]|uniref:extracellular solute-binding protein n=1 Tax=Amycolatopsis sp. PS_44_ISF1 TaxID=2974917 RepID=UPI0028DDF6A8|nr:extracellular solute-binding protein [Amycolatopsis sp. PS_44_ISF1]MDT8914743.1 extracellular solute-binding protein [Amycolatopsis sp. PS_44_ISF1]